MSEDEVAERFEKELRALMDRYSVDAFLVSAHFTKSESVHVALATSGRVKTPGTALHNLLDFAHESIFKVYPEACEDETPKPERVH